MQAWCSKTEAVWKKSTVKKHEETSLSCHGNTFSTVIYSEISSAFLEIMSYDLKKYIWNHNFWGNAMLSVDREIFE